MAKEIKKDWGEFAPSEPAWQAETFTSITKVDGFRGEVQLDTLLGKETEKTGWQCILSDLKHLKETQQDPMKKAEISLRLGYAEALSEAAGIKNIGQNEKYFISSIFQRLKFLMPLENFCGEKRESPTKKGFKASYVFFRERSFEPVLEKIKTERNPAVLKHLLDFEAPNLFLDWCCIREEIFPVY